LLKLTVLGDYVFMKYYHSGLNVKEMPEYIFKHSPNQSNLFHPSISFSFEMARSNIPEYDFDSGELIYRDNSGNEVKREKLDEMSINAACVN